MSTRSDVRNCIDVRSSSRACQLLVLLERNSGLSCKVPELVASSKRLSDQLAWQTTFVILLTKFPPCPRRQSDDDDRICANGSGTLLIHHSIASHLRYTLSVVVHSPAEISPDRIAVEAASAEYALYETVNSRGSLAANDMHRFSRQRMRS